MFTVFEDQVDRLVLQHDFLEGSQVLVVDLSVEHDLSTGTLTDSSVGGFAFPVWFEFLDCYHPRR